MANKYWRFSYDSEQAVQEMIDTGTLLEPSTGFTSEGYEPAKCIEKKIRVGDGLLLGKLDPDLGVGRVVAIGMVRAAQPVTKVDWKRVELRLYPNPQGGVSNWKERCCSIAAEPAKRYNLDGEFRYRFQEV